MGKIHPSIAAFLLILNVLLSLTGVAFSGREIPMKDSKNLEKKQPESFIGNDGSVLIPGMGRYMFPRPGTHFDPINYNPITGTNGGNGLPGIGSFGGPIPGQSYIPGGDDTSVPIPGVEVPVGGSIPASARP
ncbi:putative cell wall protein [Coffea eugenioides]|uniref:putative cell wall protein n=1 Tax=Coffea eugenioides TaxID=49369 RepID=UPI000F60B315|nr:putative cell wall protein [Coffea eugenioides]